MTTNTIRPVILAFLICASAIGSRAANLGPTPYLSFADSPFNGGSFSYFFLEDFEDNKLNTPGVSANTGGTSLDQGFSGSIVDSVDGDDGKIDGRCIKPNGTCISYFSGDGGGGITFSFNAGVLGSLPTSVGIVWTDGVGTTVFQAFDASGRSLGTVSGTTADNTFFGTTAEDRFYGATNAGGISSFHISSGAGGGIEVDHLQYGLDSATPEPRSLLLFGGGLLVLSLWKFRRRSI